MTQTHYGVLVLRLGLAVVFLWFGLSQLTNGVAWVSWVPDWAVSVFHLPPAMIVLLNGAFEVVGGSLLALNLWTRPAAIILTLHFALITFDIGLNEIGVRDFGLTMATFALAFLSNDNHRSDLS